MWSWRVKIMQRTVIILLRFLIKWSWKPKSLKEGETVNVKGGAVSIWTVKWTLNIVNAFSDLIQPQSMADPQQGGGGVGESPPPGSGFAPPEVFWIVFYFIIFSIFLPPAPKARLPPLKYFCPTMVCFLVTALVNGHFHFVAVLFSFLL